MLISASSTSPNQSIITNVGTIFTPFGKSTSGTDYLYFNAGAGGRKIGTNYNNLQAGNFNTIFGRFSNWPGETNNPKVKAGIIDSSGSLLDISINEISLQPAYEFAFQWHVFRLSKVLNLPAESYYLCLWIGEGTIAYTCSESSYPSSFTINENYYSPSGAIGSLTIQRNFDIFATYTVGNITPTAAFNIITSNTVVAGSAIIFDGTPSTPGFYDGNETTIVSYEWDFGDGTTGMGAKIQKTYPNAGDYLVTLRVTDSLGSQNMKKVTVWVKPVGGYSSFNTSFEETGDFAVGLEHTGNYKYWDRERYFMSLHPEAYRFWPEATIVHSGTRSAKLELVSPYDFETNRLQIMHDWGPLTTGHIWQEEWFYFPSDMPWTHPTTGEPIWRTIHGIITERMWTTNPSIRTKYQEFSWRIAVLWNRYTNKLNFEVIGLASVDNNDDGADDFASSSPIYIEFLGSEGVPRGRWFKIKTHIYRNLNDWATNPAGGYIEIWISDPYGSGEELYRKIDNIHTIGINPERIAAHPPWNEGGNMAYIASGFAHYCGGLSGSYGVPSKLYVDDFKVEAALP